MRGIALSILAAGFVIGTAIEFASGQPQDQSMLKRAQSFGMALLLAAIACIAMGL